MRDGDDFSPRAWSGTADDAWSPDRRGDDDGYQTVPMWTLASIVLGLAVLSGGTAAVVLAAACGATWWLVRAADATEVPRAPRGRSLGGSNL